MEAAAPILLIFEFFLMTAEFTEKNFEIRLSEFDFSNSAFSVSQW